MIFNIAKQGLSMVFNPARMEGRRRSTEFAFRIVSALMKSTQGLPLPAVRKKLDAAAIKQPSQRRVNTHNRSVGNINCSMVSPKRIDEPSIVIVYLHGGGYTVGSPKSYGGLLAELAERTQSLLIAPDYRLAPEHPYPAPQNDCLHVAETVIKTYPNKKIVLAGDSAGAALALNVALSLRDVNKLDSINSLLLLSPWVDPSADSGSMQSNAHTDFLTIEFLEACIDALMPDVGGHEPRQSHPAICFKEADFSRLPPTLVQYGGAEIFADQIADFCNRCRDAGVALTEQCFASQYHAFHLSSAIDSEAKRAMLSLGEFLKD